MVELSDLWLAIASAAVAVFAVSSVLHMCLPIHKTDYGKMPGEEEVLEVMRKHGLSEGGYMFPCAGDMKEMCTPEHVAKMRQGPVGFMSILPNGPVNMGRSLGLWFGYCVLVSIFVAYLGTLGLTKADGFSPVFQLTGTAAFMGYGLGAIIDTIWKGVAWSVTAKFLFDGVLYMLATALVFAWMWPS